MNSKTKKCSIASLNTKSVCSVRGSKKQTSTSLSKDWDGYQFKEKASLISYCTFLQTLTSTLERTLFSHLKQTLKDLKVLQGTRLTRAPNAIAN